MSSEYNGPERRIAPQRGRTGERGKTGDQGQQGIQGIQGKSEPIHPWRWRMLTGWIIVVSAGLILMYGAIQQNRRESCLRQYDTLQTVIEQAYGPNEYLTARTKSSKDRAMASASNARCNIIRVPWYVWWDS